MRILHTKWARLTGLFTTACVLLPLLAVAQSGHYVAGVEGIKAGSIPPPGLYTKDYNYLYLANGGDRLPPDFKVTAYVNVLRQIWITKWKILGADYGMDALVPFVYQDVTAGGKKPSKFGVGDMYVEPVLLAWHWQQFDVGAGYSIWMPIGQYDKTRMVNAGKNFWSHMATLGGTWYPAGEDKSWAVSVLNRYEINTENSDLKVTPGNNLTVEFGLSKNLQQTVDIGVTGYYQQQVTKDSGTGATDFLLDRVFGVGPEVNYFWGKAKLFISARYAYEFGAKDRSRGHTFCLTLTKIW